MGCAIGMSVAAACEIIYWITLKPIVKWINASKGNHLSPRATVVYKITRNLILLSWVITDILHLSILSSTQNISDISKVIKTTIHKTSESETAIAS